MERKIQINDIKPGMWVKVHREVNPKATDIHTSKLTLSIGVITHIPTHRRFRVVQFYNKKGKQAYKQCFCWSDILSVINNCRNEAKYE